MKTYFYADSPAADFWQKILKANETAIKNLSIGIDFKLLIPPLIYKINTQHKWCEKLGRNVDWRLVMTKYVCRAANISH